MINSQWFVQRVGDAERVTSVITAHRPAPGLLASVRSLAAQSWTNHEILLVDDGSPHGYDDVLRAAAALDPRVRLMRRDDHDGRYAARNAAMDEATGTYVTFQEADAWSHPLRLERQVAALRADPDAAGVTCSAYLACADLRAWTSTRGPLMIRRTPERFDTVRHGGEDEFVDRLRTVRHPSSAAFEALAVLLRRDGEPHHAARRAYRSAYRAWHRSGADKTAKPETGRPFPAPWPLLGRRGRRACDVLMVADWTRADAGLGKLRALKRSGMRVTALHLGGEDDLDRRAQAAFNDGEFELVDLADDVRARLVVVRDPAVLRAAPDAVSGLRATRVVLEAQAATAPDPCVRAARRLFGVDPLWAPAGPGSRASLKDAALTEIDVPGTVDPEKWLVDRRDTGSRRPVVGRQCAGDSGEWLRLRAELPEHPMLDVRLRDSSGTARHAFGFGGPPAGWLVYAAGEVGPRAFLQQVDFYLPLPTEYAPADAEPAVLAAMAAGCVVVLPGRYAPAYGDAAVYSTGAGLTDTIRTLHGRRAAVAEQRERGREFVRRMHGHDRYAERITALTP